MHCRVSLGVCSCSPTSAQETHKNWEPGGHPNSNHISSLLPPRLLPPMTCIKPASQWSCTPPSCRPCRVRAALLPCSQPIPLASGLQWLPCLPHLYLSPACFSPHYRAAFRLRSAPGHSQQAETCGAALAGACRWVGDPCAKGDGARQWLWSAVVLGRGKTLLGASLVPGKASRAAVGGMSDAVILMCS